MLSIFRNKKDIFFKEFLVWKYNICPTKNIFAHFLFCCYICKSK